MNEQAAGLRRSIEFSNYRRFSQENFGSRVFFPAARPPAAEPDKIRRPSENSRQIILIVI
jgi:hypothetical protein